MTLLYKSRQYSGCVGWDDNSRIMCRYAFMDARASNTQQLIATMCDAIVRACRCAFGEVSFCKVNEHSARVKVHLGYQ